MHEERYWYPDDGGQVWIAGYTPVDADGRYLARGAPELTARGLRVCGVAGAAVHHGEALAADAAAPEASAAAWCWAAPATPHTRRPRAASSGASRAR